MNSNGVGVNSNGGAGGVAQSMRFESYVLPSSSVGGITSSSATLVQQPTQYSAPSVFTTPTVFSAPSVFSPASVYNAASVYSAPSYETFSFNPQQQQQSIIGAPSAAQAPIGMGRVGGADAGGIATQRDQLYQLCAHNGTEPTFGPRYEPNHPFLFHHKSHEVESAPTHHTLGALTDNAYYYTPFPTASAGDFYDTRMLQRLVYGLSRNSCLRLRNIYT